MLSSDSEASPEKQPEASRPVSNGYGFAGMPSPDIVQMRLNLLQKAFPNRVSMFDVMLQIFCPHKASRN